MFKRSVSVLTLAGVLSLLGARDVSAIIAGDDAWKHDISITSLPFAKAMDENATRTHGVAVCALRVSNRSAVAHTVRLSCVSGDWRKEVKYQQECRLEPKQSALVRFHILPERFSNQRIVRVEIDGVPKGVFVLDPFPWGTAGLYSGQNPYLILLSPSIPGTGIMFRNISLRGDNKKVDENLKHGSLLDGQIPVSEWPAQWLAYTPADCVVLTQEEWETVPQDVRTALLGYLQAGGHLVLAGAAKEGGRGRVQIPVGLGTISTLSSADPEMWTKDHLEALIASASRSASQWAPLLKNTVSYPTDRVSVVPPLIPVFVVLLCVMLFLGPVLLIILAVRNKRIHLYWIAPSIAGAVSVFILILALFRDGISPITRAQSVLYLNEASQTQVQLTTLSMTAPAGLYSPLRFPLSAEVTSAPANREFASGSRRRTVKIEEELVLSSAWVPARVPMTFLLRDVQALTIPMLRVDDMKVTNPYPVPLQRLLYCDAEGNHFTFVLDAPVPPGATALLKPYTPGDKAKAVSVFDTVKGTFFDAKPLDTVNKWFFPTSPYLNPLPPKTFLCELDGTPFLEHPIRRGNVRHQGKTLILGEMK